MKNLLLMILALALFTACQEKKAPQGNAEMETFITDLMGQMTLEEKLGQLNLITPGGGITTGAAVSTDVEAKIKAGKVGGVFGITGPEKIRMAQDLAVEHSRLKIPLIFGLDVIHGYKATFPIPIGISCSWDLELIEKSAQVAAQEASADGLAWTFSPMVDITRDPRWGRVSEGSGEDPYLGSRVAEAMVKGYQGDDLSKNNTILSTVKHFALYGASEAGRDYNTVDMSRIRMYNDYLPPYKAAVDAGVGSVMSSFNDVDGIPATGNRWLLTEILRDNWGFKGLVVSDYTSVNEMIAHGMGDLQAVSALALNAGLDMDMVGEGFLTTLQQSLEEGKVKQADIDQACRRVLEAKYKLGLFDDPYRYIDESRPANEILTAENRQIAREVASNSFVLLKNEGNVLPLKKSGTIGLVGPLANNKNNMLGTWAVSGDPQLSVPVMEGMANLGGTDVKILYAKGANISNDPEFAAKINVFGERIDIDPRTPQAMIAEALSVAARSDVVVAVVGEASEMSGEAASRTDISLPEPQKELLKALKNTGKPLVVVLMTGRPLTIPEEKELADAILLTWHPGVEAGNAIADVLFGDVNPSGKLTMTFPRNVGQIPIYYSIRSTGRPGATEEFQKFQSYYLDAPNSPLYTFGYGLSYTTFEFSDLTLSQASMPMDGTMEVSVKVTNTGDRAGQEVVQLYIRDLVATQTRPVKELKGFKKISLDKGETQTVTFTLTADDLAFYHMDMSLKAEPGEFTIFAGPGSHEGLSANFTLTE